jgi:hypothetical protein
MGLARWRACMDSSCMNSKRFTWLGAGAALGAAAVLLFGAAAPPKYALVSQVPWTNTGGIVRPLTNNNVIYSPGTENVGPQPVNDGSTVKLLWVPGKGAFRAGSVPGGSTNWDYNSMGYESAAFGLDTYAPGDLSFSIGNSTFSLAAQSFSGGSSSIASNVNSFTFGSSTRSVGAGSTSFGQNSIASGSVSFCCGADGIASGTFSFVANDANVASGASSSAFGFGSTVRGENAFTAGENNNADGFDNINLGANNRTTNAFAHAFGNGVTNLTPNSLVLGSNGTTMRILGKLTSLIDSMNLGVSGNIWGTNGVASYSTLATNAIGTTGYTNNQVINQTAYVTATAVAFTIKDRAQATLYVSPVLTATLPVNLQPGWSITAASGLVGTVLPF